jgi:agmatinase
LVALHIDSHTDAYPYTSDSRYNAATRFTNRAEEGVLDASS